MPESFNQYEKMKAELSNELSLSFHQLLMDNLNATNNARKENLESEKRLNDKISCLEFKIQPVVNIFNNVDGAFNVAKWILIGLAAIGAGIGGLYLIITEVKKFWVNH